tara:strand:- start:33 stop:482 length:450 start_codon:yes stop_codon:yes gene_type:complete
MINITSDCDPSLVSPDLNCIKVLVKKIFSENNIKDAELSFIFCTDNRLSNLKKKFFNKDYLTDVIAFRLNNYEEKNVEGEIYISLPRAEENAQIYEEPYGREVARLIIHGCLHLIGYLDKTKKQKKIMSKNENYFLKKNDWINLFQNDK